ncbi:MAG: AAA family ATPase [Micromonosporaceae bacterium]
MSRPRFEIARVKLRHYRSIKACDVSLGPLTLLVGPNGAGKSNFLDALRLTAQSLTENLDNALRERGGAGEVRRRSRGHPTHFGIDVRFSSNGTSGRYAFQVAAERGGDFRISHEECRVSSSEFGEMDHYFVVRNGALIEHTEPVMPPVPEDRLLLVTAAGIPAFRPVFDGLSSSNVYNLNPDAMRHLQKPESSDLLRRDGSNIASVLERLRREQPDVKARIEEYLSRVVEGVVGVDRKGLGAWETVEFRQRVAGDKAPWTFQATSMSDGTLRALGVLASLFAGSETVDSPVGIEEPEAALHPAAAGLLLDVLRDASATRQVLVTTHSPDLLDSPTITEDELLAVKARDGVTEIGRVDRAGQLALRESLYTPGELLRVNQLAPSGTSDEQMELFA